MKVGAMMASPYHQNLIKYISQLDQEGISDLPIQIFRNSEFIQEIKSSKILVYLNCPFLAQLLEDCDQVIIDTTNERTNSETILVEQFVNVSPYPFEITQVTNECYQAATNSKKYSAKCDQEISTPPDPSYSCSNCGKVFLCVRKLRKHINNVHQDVECKVCQRRFTSKASLKNHEELHFDSSLKVKCDICGKVMKQAVNLKSHRLTHFNSSKHFDCDICSKSFRTSSAYKQHKSIHSSKIFSCYKCGKEFSVNRYLSQHMKRCV